MKNVKNGRKQGKKSKEIEELMEFLNKKL